MSSETTAKRTTQKLQRAIVDGLEDVKAQDIQVFDSEHLSALFERVIVASGTSNRQTRALAVSVCDAVRTAGFPKPRIEGEENGEWIIVDCGAAVVHIMQPAIRQYYTLEDIWGDKPVRLRLGASKPVAKKAKATSSPKAASSKSTEASSSKPKAEPGIKSSTVKPRKASTATKGASSEGSTPVAAKKTATASASKRASVTSDKTSAARKTAEKTATTKTVAAKAATAKKTTAEKSTASKATSKKTASKK